MKKFVFLLFVLLTVSVTLPALAEDSTQPGVEKTVQCAFTSSQLAFEGADAQNTTQNCTIIATEEEIAGRGCCSRHQGVCGCSDGGRAICCDSTLSPSCGC